MSKKPTVLMILDGYGLNEKTEGNAVKEAKTPVMDKLMQEYPFVRYMFIRNRGNDASSIQMAHLHDGKVQGKQPAD